jgi:hypothetical protein
MGSVRLPVPSGHRPFARRTVPHSHGERVRGVVGALGLSPMSEPPPPRCRRSQLRTADFLSEGA